MKYKALFSRESDNWYTPSGVYLYLEKKYGLSKEKIFDPCPLGALENGYDGLDTEWSYENIYINPPYSNIKEFVNKAIITHKRYKNNIIFLIPARTDTHYFLQLFEYGCDFYFINGRLKFGGSKNSAPFPSVIIKLNGVTNKIDYISKEDIR